MLLTSWLTSLWQLFKSSRTVTRRRRTSRSLTVRHAERLEPRVMLSASAFGVETQVNLTATGNQFTSVTGQGGNVAMDGDGDYVVTWSSYGRDGDGYGVFAQRYNAQGVAQGGEFQVNSTAVGNQLHSTVAMDAAGDFVVTWTSAGQDGSGYGIYAQRYNSAGVAQGNEFRVNNTVADNQQYSTVAMDAAGDFVVTWSSYAQDGDGWGIYARRFNSVGVAQGNEFLVNQTTTGDQVYSTIAMDADGDYVVTWSSSAQDGSGWGVYGRTFSASGTASSEFIVNTETSGDQRYSNVAMDLDGDFVVTWTSYGQDGGGFGIYAQRFNAAAAMQGLEFIVNETTSDDQFVSTVAMDAVGNFVVTWSSVSQDGSNSGVYGRQYDAAGTATTSEFLINSTTTDNQSFSSVAMDLTGDFAVAWQSYLQDGDQYGIYAQQYKESADVAGPIVAQIFNGSQQIAPGADLVTSVASLTVVFSEDMNVTGGVGGANSVTNPANWSLTKNGVDISANISGITFGYNVVTNKYEAVLSFTTPLANGVFQVTAKQTIQDLSGNALDGDLNGTPGGDFTQSFAISQVSPSGGETLVNTTTANSQVTKLTGQAGSIAMDATGGYTIVWDSLDGSGWDVYAQRYSSAGVALGTEFLVNSNTTGNQRFGSVAMDAAGDFVVTWSDYSVQDGSLSGVYAQRYDSDGNTQGGEFRVNTTTAGNQAYSTVAMDTTGDFVVTWTSYNQDAPNSFGVFAQRYNAAGIAVGSEFQVNTETTGTQAYSTVAMDAAGDFVVTWISDSQDGSGWGIFGQRYNAAGVAQGAEFQVNTTTANHQQFPTVAMDAAGDFVVTWMSDSQDGSGQGIYAQRYNAIGTPQGTEFLVNTTTLSDQSLSAVAMNAAGDFIITWTSDGQDGSASGIFAQAYSAAGVPQGPEFQVNTTTAGNQFYPSVAADSRGDFAVVWTDGGQDGSLNGVYSQLYRADISSVLTSTSNITYTENDPATAINTGITIADADNTTLATATITITNFVAGQDVLSFTNDGSTMGNIAILNNLPGVLSLTSAGSTATLAEWQAALRAVKYANTSETPDTTTRSVDFVVNDGLSLSNTLTSTIAITATNDAPILANIETNPLLYAPNAAATTITSTITLTDYDSANITGATITISTGYQAGDVLGFSNTPNISAVYNAGTLTLSGTDTVANYEAALRSVLYVSTSQSPATRTISFQVTDGSDPSNTVTRDVGGYAQLSGTTLNVYGTNLADTISVSEGASLDVVVNGVLTQFTPAQVTSIFIFGFDGSDNIQINSLNNGTAMTAYGMKGNDIIRVNAAVTQGVTLNGAADNDLLIGGSGNDLLLGGVGNDWLNGGDGYDTLQGGVGNDVYAFSDTTTNQIDTVVELNAEGTDTLNFSALTVAVTADLTSDTALATTIHQIVQVGAAGQSANFENVYGGSGNDVITGNALNNLLLGNGGNDTLNGGDGNDQLDGGQGADLLQGGNNDDVLIGGIGDDYLNGDAGSDYLDGGDGFNVYSGAAGNDRYIFRNATVNQVDTIMEQPSEGTDTLDFSVLTNAIYVNLTSDTGTVYTDFRIVQAGAGQAANFENVYGGSGDDQIFGNDANNLLSGNGGNDTINGGAGDDILLGGQGNDVLQGGLGRNILISGAGGDVLQGGADDDLMLSGSLTYESDPAILNALMAEWSSATPYASRVSHLLGNTGGGLNTSFIFSPSTYTSDSSADYLTGSAGQDWFLADAVLDVINDKAGNEVFTHIGNIATSGFNDVSGVNSDGAANNQPFNTGSVSLNGQGVGEPGWAGPWLVTTGAATTTRSASYEGDGAAAFFQNTAVASRKLSVVPTGTFRVDVRIMVPNTISRDVIFRVYDSGGVDVGAIAVQWAVGSDFSFFVLDGIGDGSNITEPTGIKLTPGQWAQVTTIIDPVSKTWTFAVDGQLFNAPDPLGFRSNPAKLDSVQFLNEIAYPDGSYLDYVVVTQ